MAPHTGATASLKLLIDEMWSPDVASELRRRGHDAVAVKERPDLISASDAVVFAVAQSEGRAILSENTPDFRRIARALLDRGETHAGLIFTSNRSYPRAGNQAIGRLVRALDRLLTESTDATSLELWLH